MKIIIYNYLTTNSINGKQYVGMHTTNNINDGYLGLGKYFLRAVKKWGKKNFSKRILCYCETTKEAFKNEEIYIKKYNTLVPKGYNISPTGGTGNSGGRHSEESKKKFSKTRTGRKLSKEHRKRLSESHLGFKHSEETKRKISKNHRKTQSIETRRKISQSRKDMVFSEQHCRHLSKAHKGNKLSEEAKNKVGIASLGRKHSEETKNKLRLLVPWNKGMNKQEMEKYIQDKKQR